MRINAVKMRRASVLLVLWGIGAFISAINFQMIWNRLPDFQSQLSIHLIYAVLALPQSFLHLASWTTDAVIRLHGLKFLAVLLVYWGVLGWLHARYLRKGSGMILIAIAVIILISAPRWLYYAVGMSGI